nr:thermonuclease family protein [Phenylobacterium sp.]
MACIAAFGFALSRQLPPQFPLHRTTAQLEADEVVLEGPARPGVQREGIALALGEPDFECEGARVTDGDTLRCGPLRVRLASIDAPEMPGHCRAGRNCVEGDPHLSKLSLERLIANSSVLCRQTDTDRYGRIVALCMANGRDLSCSQVQAGQAIIRYGELDC